MEIRNETIDRVTNYLSARPWNEVEPLMHEISDQIAVMQRESARVAEEAKVKTIEARIAEARLKDVKKVVEEAKDIKKVA